MRINMLLFICLVICSCDNGLKVKIIDRRTDKEKALTEERESENKNDKEGIILGNTSESVSPNAKTNEVVNPPSQTTQETRWRQDVSSNEYAEYIRSADGPLSITYVTRCMACYGSGICSGCRGAGGIFGRAYGGMYYPCTMCLQTGKCRWCKGEGIEVTHTFTDASGHSTSISSNGSTAVGGPGGSVVTTPDGKSYGHPSRGGGYTESSSKNNSSNDRRNDYIEKVEYTPNYTGESNNAWCEKCGKIAPRHSHIRQRVY